MASNDKYLIELIYDDLLVAEAETLFEKKAIIDVQSPEKNLFLFVIQDGTDLEVELFKPFTKVQKSTCSCAFHQKHKICKHVIAGLFYLREKKKKRKEPHHDAGLQKIKTLNTRTLLQFVEREELIQFVQQYAKSDPKFALQLKVHFARKVDLPDNREKYKILLDTIIKPYTGKSKPGAGVLRAFLQVSEELTGQAYDCLALQNFEEALFITEAGLLKFCYVRHYFGMDSPAFTRQFEEWHALAETFLKQKISFDLKKRLINFLVELVGMSYYRHTETKANLLRILDGYLTKPEKNTLVSTLSEKIHPVTEEEKAVFYALLCLLAGKIPPLVREILKKPGFQLTRFYRNLLQLNQHELVLQELEKGPYMPGFDKDKHAMLATLYAEKNQWANASKHGLTYFTACGDLSLFKELKTASGEDVWKKELYPALLSSMQKEAGLKSLYLGQFLQAENDWSLLLSMLYEKDDIHLLYAFGPQLVKVRPDETETLFTEHVRRYLEGHLGDVAHDYIKHLFENLEKLKLFSIKKSILHLMKNKFGDRQSIQAFLDSHF